MLLTATKDRLPYLPDLPTAAEAGLPGYLMSVWIGVVAPAGTPQPMLDSRPRDGAGHAEGRGGEEGAWRRPGST